MSRHDPAVASPQFIYVLRPTRPAMLAEGLTDHELAVVETHSQYLRDLAGRGAVLVYGRTQTSDERTFGIVVFEAPDENAARTIMQNDPAVRDGVMTAELFPFRAVFERGR